MQDFESVQIGQEASLEHHITENDVQTFADLTGDHNPLHLDEDFAGTTKFKKRVVHGMLTASFISTIIGMTLPGPGSLYLGQDLNFKRPVFLGDTIHVRVKVAQKVISTRMVTLETVILNQDAKTVISGTAKVLWPQTIKEI